MHNLPYDVVYLQCIKLTEMSTSRYGPVDCKEHWSVQKATDPQWLGLHRAKEALQEFRLDDPFQISYSKLYNE